MSDATTLFEAVRKACLSALWSQGVKLARADAIRIERRAGSEIVVRVRAPGLAVAPTVTLFVEDAEWSCDCAGKVDPCAHVAAAVIALSQEGRRGDEGGPESAPLAGPTAVLSYRFRSDGPFRVALDRFVVLSTGEEELLDGSLSSLAAGAAPRVGAKAALVPTHDDLKADVILSSFRRGHFEQARARDVLGCLGAAVDVRFDGQRVRVSDEPVYPKAFVEDERGSVVLRIVVSEQVSRVVARGVALLGDSLRPLGETELTGETLELLPLVRRFRPEQLGELVAEVLPALEKRLVVDVRSRRLPKTGRVEVPRIHLECTQDAHSLSVLPTLVYGDPPRARVDEGALVHLDGPIPIRDLAAEKELVFRLRDHLNLVFGRRANYDGQDAVRFLARLRAFSSSLGDGRRVERAGDVRFAETPLVPRFSLRDDTFELSFEVSDGSGGSPRRADGEAVLRAWQDGVGWAALEGGGFAPLPADWLAKHGQRVADLLATRQPDGSVPKLALPVLAELCDELGEGRPPGLRALAPLFDGLDKIPAAVLPTDVTAELRPYQRRGVDWLCFLRDAGLGAVLADDMGLGKTLQALCAFRGKVLVVCPKSVLFNWHRELARFRPGLRVALYHGPGRQLDPAADVTLTTYAVLRMEAETLAALSWDGVVLDEAQNIKNADSQVARAAYSVPAPFRLALSGTPVENRLEELWSLLRFTSPGLLGGRTDFSSRYAAPIAQGDASVAERLRRRIRPFLLRRTKREVAPELPPRTDLVLSCELDPSERAVYDAVRAATQKDIVERLREGGSVLAALEALLRLRQAACHSALVPGQQASSSSKIEALVDALSDATADGHKSLVFSQWTSLLDHVEPHLAEAGIGFERLDGSTRDRAGVVGRFQADDGPPVLLASLKAGGTGLNLTAADHVFLLDPWWNPAAEDQAADRAHRIGQEKPVLVYRLVAKDTVEEKILALQERKRAIGAAALDGTGGAVDLTRDELAALLD